MKRVLLIVFSSIVHISYGQERIARIISEESNIVYFQKVPDSFFKRHKPFLISPSRGDTTYFVSKFVMKEGEYEEWYNQDQIMKRVVVSNTKKAIESYWTRHGIQTIINGEGYILDTGECISKISYKNGARNGWQVNTTLSDTIISKIFFIDDMVNEIISYHENSNTIYEIKKWKTDPNYLSTYSCSSYGYQSFGTYDGEYRRYFPNGILECIGKYNLGEKYGEWVYYYFNGIIKSRHYYDKNISFYYNKDGIVKSKQEHELFAKLIQNNWYIKGDIGADSVVLSKVENSSNEVVNFNEDQYFSRYVMLECKFAGSNEGGFTIEGNKLILQDYDDNWLTYDINFLNPNKLYLTRSEFK